MSTKDEIYNVLKKNLNLYFELSGNTNNNNLYYEIISMVEKSLFKLILEYTKYNQIKASKLLGISRTTLRTKIKKLDIVKDDYEFNYSGITDKN